MTLAETGTRALLGAVFGPRSIGEITYAARLVDRLDAGMLVLADRAFDGGEFLAAVRTTGAQFLVRIRSGRRLPRLAVLPDGSILTRLGRLNVRTIQAQVTTRLADGSRSLLDHRAHPAVELIELYHERWEIESSFLALPHTLLQGRGLRSMDPAGLEQELWSLLALYQILRHAIVDAARSRPGLDPDRVSFTAAAAIAQATMVRAAGIAEQHDAGPAQAITTAALAHPLPARRARLSARKVKSPISRYVGHPLEERPLISTRITGIDIDVEEPGTVLRPEPSATARAKIMNTGSRVNQVFALLRAEPDPSFTPTELTRTLKIDNINSFSVQLATWARRGLLGKPARGRYNIPNNCPQAKPLTCDDEA